MLGYAHRSVSDEIRSWHTHVLSGFAFSRRVGGTDTPPRHQLAAHTPIQRKEAVYDEFAWSMRPLCMFTDALARLQQQLHRIHLVLRRRRRRRRLSPWRREQQPAGRRPGTCRKSPLNRVSRRKLSQWCRTTSPTRCAPSPSSSCAKRYRTVKSSRSTTSTWDE